MEKKESKKHKRKIKEMLEMRGVTYISTPRPQRRGGGSAIAIRNQNFRISKLNVKTPKGIETTWALIKPKEVTGSVSEIIACCFYSPPKSKKRNELIDHMTTNLQSLLTDHPNAGVVIAGDRNDIEIPTLLSIDPSLRQIVKQPT